MSELFTIHFRTAAFRSRLFILRTEFAALASTLPELGAQTAVDKAKATTSWKDRTGNTRKAIRARPIGPHRWRFSAGGKSLWLNQGTGIYGPHNTPIVPTHAKFLRFTIGNRLFFRRSVKGQKATHFVDKARDQAEVFIHAEATSRLQSIIQAFNR